MKISIITVSFNSAATLETTLLSVAEQSYADREHIIVDGGSTDGTLAIIDRYRSSLSHVISEPDDGIYDAMNKGIALATGEIVGILNSDDLYAGPAILEKIAGVFSDPLTDACYSDLVYVRPDNLERVVRYYSGAGFKPDRFAWGWMPPHPTFFVRRALYGQYGLFKTDYKIAADFELTARLLFHHKVRYAYLPEVTVRMRTGGVSTAGWRSTILLNQEVLRACRENGIKTNVFKVLSKYPYKILEFVFK